MNHTHWNANHQRESLKEYGLDEEFGKWGCDAIGVIAEALVLSRKEVERQREAMGDIKRHMETSVPTGYKLSAVWQIANKAKGDK